MKKRIHNVDSPLRQVESEPHQHKHLFASGMWQKIHHFFAKDDPTQSPIECPEDDQWPADWDRSGPYTDDQSSSRPVGVGLPRQATFRRQNSERRERLLAIEPGHAERRALSSTRNVSTSLPRPRATSSPPNWEPGRVSAPAIGNTVKAETVAVDSNVRSAPASLDPLLQTAASDDLWSQTENRPPRPPSTTSSDESHYGDRPMVDDKADLRAELDSRWILNLSMHFRDKSDREKFFVTYAQTPNHWRRVTISCDYRNAEPGSLEMDLKELQFQRDKSLQIYESIRDSLPEIQFYDTVTNLKLETTDGRLHVHVTEDVNEIIPYPPRTTVAHILDDTEFQPMEVQESELIFDSHLSGFVYKIRHKGRVYIKKEIPGPDTVDEFLYEINALHALHGSGNVIALEAIIVDDMRETVKGLLISYAERGAIVDLLYDNRGSTPWEDRCRWAENAVRGLSEIHEEGYVQGDFTLSNIVVDGENNAKIIDINRRGCPVGWEPPEIAVKIASNQRISMYIGEKSDLYQLGMTLWALAMDDDEPERHAPPLSVDEFPSEVPEWYQSIVRTCLSTRPRDRLSAKELVDLFPEGSSSSSGTRSSQRKPQLQLLAPKEYIDPADAVERDDLERFSHDHQELDCTPYSPESSRDDYTFTYPKSSNYELESESSAYDRPRGRRPPTNFAHLGTHERRHWIPDVENTEPIDEVEPNIVAISPGMDREIYDEVDLNGHAYLVRRGTFNLEEMQILGDDVNAERQFEDQASQFDNESVDVAGPLDSNQLYSSRRPPLLTRNSTTSDITPRGSQTVLPTYSPSPSEQCLTDSNVAVELNALGSHPDLNTSAPHAEENGLGRWKSADPYPPRLPYEDSGYDEPLNLGDDLSTHDVPGSSNDSGNTYQKQGREPRVVDTPVSEQSVRQILAIPDTTAPPHTMNEIFDHSSDIVPKHTPQIPSTESLDKDLPLPKTSPFRHSGRENESEDVDTTSNQTNLNADITTPTGHQGERESPIRSEDANNPNAQMDMKADTTTSPDPQTVTENPNGGEGSETTNVHMGTKADTKLPVNPELALRSTTNDEDDAKIPTNHQAAAGNSLISEEIKQDGVALSPCGTTTTGPPTLDYSIDVTMMSSGPVNIETYVPQETIGLMNPVPAIDSGVESIEKLPQTQELTIEETGTNSSPTSKVSSEPID
ncbi:serine/threonine protein kinase [Exophiala aquamarina CBS 119918]|uniref:Serine/threonine protein kinase n=1 Tax=Exophiala aquamarina CBS 119918 TaxID=1182545 RepID=A0A072PVZ2_9EURO|nr:serine/threonine protein kinase [Exophiala aquamarina CBS 119918]KEF59730.1 serine/threonine protein kinase [Exophiala aquamarina CBS 119918]